MSHHHEPLETTVRAGGVLGFLGFLLLGLKPAIIYGGMTGVVLASAMTGGHVDGDALFVRILVGGGMVLSVLAVASVMTVLGAAAAYLLGALIVAPRRAREPQREPAAEAASGTHES